MTGSLSYSVIQILSWVTVGALLYLVIATVGFDFGAGMLSRFVGKTDNERRAIVNIVAPTWDGNQVWLITAGAGMFAIWPRAYAASFSGLYLGILVVLWGLFLRPVAFEYRSKIESLKWRGFWDWMLCLGSFIPLLVMGVAVGNLFLGFPMEFSADTLRFYYGAQGVNGMEPAFISLLQLLMPYALLFGVFAVVMCLMHGASYCAMRTKGVLFERFNKLQKFFAILFIILFAVAGIWLMFINGFHYAPDPSWKFHSDAIYSPLKGALVDQSTGGWLANYGYYPWMIIAPVLGFLGAIGVIVFAGKDKVISAFCSSLVATLGAVFTMGFSLFPFVMPSSTNPEQSLTLWNASSSEVSLLGILIVAVIMLPIIFTYTTFVYKKMWGRGVKMDAAEVEKRKFELY